MELAEFEILDIDRAPVPAGAPGGAWTCGSCRQPYSVRDGWKIRFRDDSHRDYTTFVCASCAASARRPS